MTNNVNPSVKMDKTSSESQALTEEKKWAGFKSREPQTRDERLENTSLDLDNPEEVVVRVRTDQRARHDLEDPRVEDPMSGEGVGERREGDEEVMRRSRGQRFQRFLEEYL